MGDPNPNNPGSKRHEDNKKSGTDPLGKHHDPKQQGQGRDPMKEPKRQQDKQGDQKGRGGQDTRKQS
jgi:hypothetical protein